MSLISALTAARLRTERGDGRPDHGDTLAALATGQSACVAYVDADGDTARTRRLFDLGFVPGAEVRMVRKAPLADPVVFRVAGYEIALRREQARWVRVEAPAS